MTFTEILTEARRLVKADSTSYTTADITVSVNRAYDRVVALIRESEGRWQWDDANATDVPIAVTGLVANQQDYTLDLTHLEIERLEVQDDTGAWTKLAPIDQADIYNQAATDFLNTAGVPMYYDKIGTTLYLYPKPSYSQDESLKIFYKRGPSYFATNDTTKAPGFTTIFHRILPLYAAYDYSIINQLPIKGDMATAIAIMETDIQNHYTRRDRDDKLRLRTVQHNYR
jgi:hypothetical protein